MRRFKKGAASFYVVAFSTLVLLIVVASFTALVVAQITRSSNDDLSQSAYDSALAGIEDAKLAYYNYQNCVAQGVEARKSNNDGSLNCSEIVYLVENSEDDCDVVAEILGRNIEENYGVSIDETSAKNESRNNMQQAYTCVKIKKSLPDYRSSVSAANPLKVINVKLDDMGDSNINANAVKKVKISWGSDLNDSDVNLGNFDGSKVEFPEVSGEVKAANPPTIAFALVQAEASFGMDSFDLVGSNQTNRAMVYLTPVTTEAKDTSGKEANYNGTRFAFDNSARMGVSKIDAASIVNSNNAAVKNYPYGVSCPYVGADEFACAVMIDLPDPIDSNDDGVGVRSDENFMVAVMLPYGASTDFMLEFFCGEGMKCGEEKVACEEGDDDCEAVQPTEQVNLNGVQIGVDSTGRANDLYRRVDTRLEGSDDFAISIMGPLELFGEKNASGNNENIGLDKNFAVTCEWDFSPVTGPECLR